MSKEIPEILRYFLEDLLNSEIGYSYRGMFGGYSIYKFGKIFAILDDNEEFYFKTGENNLQDYLDIGAKPFTYEVKGKIHQMCYYKIPENILEDRSELKLWIKKSLEVPVKNQKKILKTKDLKKQVLEYLLTIPKGKVSTYKIISDTFGVHPRTIASIMKQNTNQEIFPCYKVIASDGSFGGYNLGIEEKIKRLENDGIEIQNGKIDKKYFVK